MKKIVITGGAGYIGYHIVKKLLKKKKYKIVVIDIYHYQKNTLREFANNTNLKIIKGDICNIKDLTKALKNADSVIALAAIVGDPAAALNEQQTLDTNFHSTDLLISLCNYYGVKRLVFASSCSVYGADDILLNEGSKLNPLSLYAKTRIMSEQLIMRRASPKLEWSILRLSTVFGWSQRMRFDLVVNFLTAKAFHDKQIQIFGKSQWRPLIHVQDVAEAFIKVALAKKSIVDREIFNVGNNRQNYQIKDIAEKVAKYIPRTKINYQKIADKDKRNYKVNFDKIHSCLNYSTKYSLDYGIKEIVSNLKKIDINYLDDIYYNVKYLFKKNGK